MKNLPQLALALGIVFMGFAQAHAAAPIPNCWMESGADVADGQFLVGLDTAKMSKEQLVFVLDNAKGRNTVARNFPMVFGQHIYILVEAFDGNAAPHKLDRPTLQRAVYAELSRLAEIPGVTFACNGRVYPAPAIGVRN